MTWELIWMLLILKIPVVYLCLVVWWAVKRRPAPLEPVVARVTTDIEPRPGWYFQHGRRPEPGRRPHGGPARGYRRRVVRERAER